MIIYFNFFSFCVEIVDTRGAKKSRAFSFDSHYADCKDFKSIIENTIRTGVREELARESHIVVLPDFIMGVGLISVPYSLFKKEENFVTKFNLLYDRDSSLVCDKHIICNKAGITTYAFSAVKKSYLFEISSAFSDMGITINGFTFYSKLLSQYISTNLSYKANALVFDKGEKLSIYGMVRDVPVGQMHLPLKEDDVATDYLQSVISSKGKKMESDISLKLKTKDTALCAISDFEDYYSSSGITFDRKFNLTSLDIGEKVSIDREEVLRLASSCRLMGKKRCLGR